MAERDNNVRSVKPKRKGLIIAASIMLGIIVTFFAVWLILKIVKEIVIEKYEDFTEQEHIERITERARKRYITGDGQYTDLQVYPLYDRNDEMRYALIELEPAGYEYVRINDDSLYHGLYTRSDTAGKGWARYTVELGTVAEIEINGKTYSLMHAKWTELDENDKPIQYKCSHFKAANITNERRYLLEVKQGSDHGYMVGVKRDDKFFNLVSMEYIDYQYSIETISWATAILSFIPEKVGEL